MFAIKLFSNEATSRTETYMEIRMHGAHRSSPALSHEGKFNCSKSKATKPQLPKGLELP